MIASLTKDKESGVYYDDVDEALRDGPTRDERRQLRKVLENLTPEMRVMAELGFGVYLNFEDGVEVSLREPIPLEAVAACLGFRSEIRGSTIQERQDYAAFEKKFLKMQEWVIRTAPVGVRHFFR